MVKTAICDDNDAMLNFLTNKINEIFTENGISFEIQSFLYGRNFLQIHESDPFDVVFMDIVMPGMNGFEVAKQIRKISNNTYIIFVTTENSLVYESFDFQPFYFIPKGKPQVVEERLKHVVSKLIVHTAANEKILIDGAYDSKVYVAPSDILYIRSSSNQIAFHLVGGNTMMIRRKLSEFLEGLNHYIFARTHNRIVVNMQHIERVDYPNMEILLDNGEIIPISRSCKSDFEASYLRFTRNFC